MKRYSAILLIFFRATVAARVGHHHLTATGDAETDAMDAVALRRLSALAQQRAKADSTHLRVVAEKHVKAAAARELEVQEELQDARAIDAEVHLEKASALTTDEANDAEALRKVAVLEEEQVVNEKHEADRLRADAKAIAFDGTERGEAEIADAKSLEVFATNEPKLNAGVQGKGTSAQGKNTRASVNRSQNASSNVVVNTSGAKTLQAVAMNKDLHANSTKGDASNSKNTSNSVLVNVSNAKTLEGAVAKESKNASHNGSIAKASLHESKNVSNNGNSTLASLHASKNASNNGNITKDEAKEGLAAKIKKATTQNVPQTLATTNQTKARTVVQGKPAEKTLPNATSSLKTQPAPKTKKTEEEHQAIAGLVNGLNALAGGNASGEAGAALRRKIAAREPKK